MTGHTVASYDEELKTLDSKILSMGRLAERQLAAALNAIAQGSSQQAKLAVDGDAAVDAMQREIEQYTVQVIARRQPVAIDLRTIIGAMRIAGDLERIGDMAKKIGMSIGSLDECAWASPMTKSLCAMGDMALWRVGDHCTNIAESVSYIVTGQTISDGRPRHGVSGTVG